MKKIISSLIGLSIIFCILVFKEDIAKFIIKSSYSHEKSEYITNEYSKGTEYMYFKKNTNFSPMNKEELINTIYTIVDSGVEAFTFICPNEYKTCIEDVTELSQNNYELSFINDFVAPYNSYRKMVIEVSTLGKVTANIIKVYSNSDIEYINDAITKIEDAIIKDDMSNKEKILAFHNYIINNTVYDELNKDLINLTDYSNMPESNKATGLLKNGVALCGGYTDIMAIYLNKLGIVNYKIASEDHIWNFVYIDGNWKHIDVTWDDPVAKNSNKNYLIHDYFLISTTQLFKLDKVGHNFNEKFFIEAK